MSAGYLVVQSEQSVLETDNPPSTIPPSKISHLPCSIRVRVESGVRVRVIVRVGSVGLELGLGLWLGLGGNVREGKCSGEMLYVGFPTSRHIHQSNLCMCVSDNPTMEL